MESGTYYDPAYDDDCICSVGGTYHSSCQTIHTSVPVSDDGTKAKENPPRISYCESKYDSNGKEKEKYRLNCSYYATTAVTKGEELFTYNKFVSFSSSEGTDSMENRPCTKELCNDIDSYNHAQGLGDCSDLCNKAVSLICECDDDWPPIDNTNWGTHS
jgi:hypothetical protein